MIIYQADKFTIPFTIRFREQIVTPDTVGDVRIAIGDMVRSYKEGTLAYEEGKWLFALSEETTEMTGIVQGQVELIIADTVIHSATFGVKFAKSVKPFVNGGR
jgi:hypothetical protein